MALITYYQDNTNSSSEKKPLLREYAKNQEKSGFPIWEEPQRILGMYQSKSQDWIILETESFIALVHGNSQLGEDLLNLIKNLKGYCNALLIIPHKKGKLGFSIAIDDEIQTYTAGNQEKDTERPYIWFSLDFTGVAKKETSNALSLDKIQRPNPSPKASVKDLDLITAAKELEELPTEAPTKKSSQKREKSSLNGSAPTK